MMLTKLISTIYIIPATWPVERFCQRYFFMFQLFCESHWTWCNYPIKPRKSAPGPGISSVTGGLLTSHFHKNGKLQGGFFYSFPGQYFCKIHFGSDPIGGLTSLENQGPFYRQTTHPSAVQYRAAHLLKHKIIY